MFNKRKFLRIIHYLFIKDVIHIKHHMFSLISSRCPGSLHTSPKSGPNWWSHCFRWTNEQRPVWTLNMKEKIKKQISIHCSRKLKPFIKSTTTFVRIGQNLSVHNPYHYNTYDWLSFNFLFHYIERVSNDVDVMKYIQC